LKKNLVLTGMMGVGKSTIGSALAKKLKLIFFDIDKIIEKENSTTIKDIFEKEGEAKFREIEKKTVFRVLGNKESVIALGGGAFMNPEIRGKIIDKCISIWLDLDIKLLKEDIYSLANYRINCNDVDKKKIIEKILKNVINRN
jgi:shikimate kinase